MENTDTDTDIDTDAARGGPVAPPSDDPVPVVFATDIGDDVDDTWALAQLLRAPRLDVRLVLTERGDPRYRASIAAKVLERAGRTGTPIGLGVEFEGSGGEGPRRYQEPWVDGYDLDGFPGTLHDDGPAALRRLVGATDETVTVVSVGPVPTLAAALEADPELAAGCRFVGMHGSLYAGYDGGDPDAETNVEVDPAGFRRVLSAPWQDVLLTPLDTCGSARLTGERFRRVWRATDDPLVRGVIENNCTFAVRVPWMAYDDFTRRSSTLYDTVAVYLAYDESLVETERVRFDVTDDGFTAVDPDGEFEARAAVRWRDRDAFKAHLTATLLGETADG